MLSISSELHLQHCYQLREEILNGKVIDLLEEKAKITEVDPKPEAEHPHSHQHGEDSDHNHSH